MAKRVVTPQPYVLLIDDLDGRELPRGEGQTVRYGYKGTEYEIDLSDEHADELDRMMSNLVSKSVKVGKMLPNRPAPKRIENVKEELPALPSGQMSITAQREADKEFRKEIRAWAREHGFTIGDAGRIPEAIRQAWDAAHPDRPSPAESSYL